MTDKEYAIKVTLDGMSDKVRLSSIRKSLRGLGFSPEDVHEIITAALERRKESRKQRESSGRGVAAAVIVLGLIILVLTYCLAWRGGLYLVPGGLLSYGAYLWYGKPGSK